MIPRDRLKTTSLNNTALQRGSWVSGRERERHSVYYSGSKASTCVCAETPVALILREVYLGLKVFTASSKVVPHGPASPNSPGAQLEHPYELKDITP
jgi:hypothetical protein